MKFKQFFSQPRNLVLLLFCCTCLIINLAGIVVSHVKYAHGMIDAARIAYVDRQGISACFTIFLVYIAEWLLRFRLPALLEAGATLLAFAGNTVAGVYGVYALAAWDKILHTYAGLLFSAIGCSLALAFTKGKYTNGKRVLAAALFGLFFALAEGYLWEIFEFTVDSLDPTSNAQRWQGDILASYPDGTYLVGSRRGSAIVDTMLDMTVNLAGALLFLVPALVLFLKKPALADAFAVRFLPLPRFLQQKRPPEAADDTEDAGQPPQTREE